MKNNLRVSLLFSFSVSSMFGIYVFSVMFGEYDLRKALESALLLFLGFFLCIYIMSRFFLSQKIQGKLNALRGNTLVERDVVLGLSEEDCFEKCMGVIRDLNHLEINVSGMTIEFYTRSSIRSFGEKITVQVEKHQTGCRINVKSCPAVKNTLFDYNKNAENVNSILNKIQQAKEQHHDLVV